MTELQLKKLHQDINHRFWEIGVFGPDLTGEEWDKFYNHGWRLLVVRKKAVLTPAACMALGHPIPKALKLLPPK